MIVILILISKQRQLALEPG